MSNTHPPIQLSGKDTKSHRAGIDAHTHADEEVTGQNTTESDENKRGKIQNDESDSLCLTSERRLQPQVRPGKTVKHTHTLWCISFVISTTSFELLILHFHYTVPPREPLICKTNTLRNNTTENFNYYFSLSLSPHNTVSFPSVISVSKVQLWNRLCCSQEDVTQNASKQSPLLSSSSSSSSVKSQSLKKWSKWKCFGNIQMTVSILNKGESTVETLFNQITVG